MTTVINNPGGTSGEGAGTGMIIGILLAIIVIVLFFLYGLPAIRGDQVNDDNGNIDINLEVPTGGSDDGSTGGPSSQY